MNLWIGEIVGTARDGNADVLATLEDGRAFAFTAFTPEALRRAMEEENSGSFVCEDLMVLREINEQNVREAIEEMSALASLDRFGVLQQPPG